jgi:hypothetical protein
MERGQLPFVLLLELKNRFDVFVTVRRSSFGAARMVGHRRLAGSTVGGLSGLFSGPLDGCLPDLLGFGATFALGADFLKFVVSQMLDADE